MDYRGDCEFPGYRMDINEGCGSYQTTKPKDLPCAGGFCDSRLLVIQYDGAPTLLLYQPPSYSRSLYQGKGPPVVGGGGGGGWAPPTSYIGTLATSRADARSPLVSSSGGSSSQHAIQAPPKLTDATARCGLGGGCEEKQRGSSLLCIRDSEKFTGRAYSGPGTPERKAPSGAGQESYGGGERPFPGNSVETSVSELSGGGGQGGCQIGGARGVSLTARSGCREESANGGGSPRTVARGSESGALGDQGSKKPALPSGQLLRSPPLRPGGSPDAGEGGVLAGSQASCAGTLGCRSISKPNQCDLGSLSCFPGLAYGRWSAFNMLLLFG